MWKAEVSSWISCTDGQITQWLLSLAVILKNDFSKPRKEQWSCLRRMWKQDWIQDPVPTNSCRKHQQEKSLRGKGNFTFVLHPPISSPLLLSGYPSLNLVLWSLVWTLPWFWRGEPRAQYHQDGFLPHTISRCCFLSFHWKVHTVTMELRFWLSTFVIPWCC